MSRQRWLTHLALAALTYVGVLLASVYKPDAPLAHQWTIGFGYAALVLLVVTLLIGPLALLRQRKNPVNIYLRRDIGIWAGFNGLAHVWYGLQIHFRGDWVRYFFIVDDGDYEPLLDTFGWANYTGAAATVFLAFLLVLSNDVSLKALHGPRWKLLQESNHVLLWLVGFHTVAYQLVVKREPGFTWAAGALFIAYLALQAIGMWLYRTRKRVPS